MICLSPPEEQVVGRVLAERREREVERLIHALEAIAGIGPEKEPKPQPGSDRDPLLAYEDGHSEAAWEAALIARNALDAWEEASA